MRRFAPMCTNGKNEEEDRLLEEESEERERGMGLVIAEEDEGKLRRRSKGSRHTEEGTRISRRDRALDRQGPIGRIVVPKALIRDILNVYHGIPLTGHLGKDKTVYNVSQHLYWAGLTKDVHNRIRGCHLCQMRRQTRPHDTLIQVDFMHPHLLTW
jgi:hypothetical protein